MDMAFAGVTLHANMIFRYFHIGCHVDRRVPAGYLYLQIEGWLFYNLRWLGHFQLSHRMFTAARLQN
jgi:hypothetical protein